MVKSKFFVKLWVKIATTKGQKTLEVYLTPGQEPWKMFVTLLPESGKNKLTEQDLESNHSDLYDFLVSHPDIAKTMELKNGYRICFIYIL